MRNKLSAPLALLGLLAVTVSADAKGGPVKSTPEIADAAAVVTKFADFAKRDCEAGFEVLYDLRRYDTYRYDAEYTRAKLLGTGYLGKIGSEFFAEMSSVCRTFSGNKPTTCVPHLKKLKKIVLESHPKMVARNRDGFVRKVGADTLTIIYAPTVGAAAGHYIEKLEALYDCDHGTALD